MTNLVHSLVQNIYVNVSLSSQVASGKVLLYNGGFMITICFKHNAKLWSHIKIYDLLYIHIYESYPYLPK